MKNTKMNMPGGLTAAAGKLVLSLLAAAFIFSGCGMFDDLSEISSGISNSIDYSKSQRWLSLPSSSEKTADVFYLYPTSFFKVDTKEANICEIDNAVMLKYSKSALARQAAAFEPACNVYAPYYRQADAASTLALPLAQQEIIIGGIPRADAMAAFDYYIKHHNNGRPFILAGHSQGSNVLLYLLSEYMRDNPKVYARMIAAYVIGYSVTADYLARNPHLKFAEGPDDIGVIISYNTEAPQVSGNNPVLLPGAISINPINWSRDEKLAAASENAGSLITNALGEIVSADAKNYADARVDKSRGVVVCSTVADRLPAGNALVDRGIYHSFDYPFYFYNIRENAAGRVKKFLNK